jgi:hypothetical protein
VKRRSYKNAVDELLLPLGFKPSNPRSWVREQTGLVDNVDMQIEPSLGTTFNIAFNDRNTWALLKEASPGMTGPSFANRRLWFLTGDPYAKWWKKGDTKGPDEVVWALKEYGLPLLDKLHDLDFQLTQCGRLFEDKPRHTWTQIWMAMTLYRLGRYDDAKRVINDPSKPLNEGWRRNLENIRSWIGAKVTETRG